MARSNIRAWGRAAVAVMALAVAAPAAEAESLADALVSAYRNSNLLEQNRALVRAADEDVALAVSALRPVVTFIQRTRWNSPRFRDRLTKTVALTASMDLYTFGQNQLAIDAAKESVLATREGLVRIEQNVLLTAVRAYMNVIRATEVVNLRESNVRLITRELRAAEDRFSVGEVTRTDVALAQSRLAAAQSNLAAARGELEVARETYNAAIGHYPEALSFPRSNPDTAANEADARAIAVRRHPEIRQAQREVTVAEINIQRAIAAMKPTISLSGEVSVDDRESTARQYGLDVTVPIYQGGRLSALHRNAIALRDAARAELLQITLLVEQEVGSSWADVLVAQARLQAATDQIRAAEIAFEGAREEARVGARTTLEVLDREQELNDARTARIAALADEVIASYTLLASMGLLTVDHLNLGITTYDPAAYYNAVKRAPATSDRGRALDRVFKSIGRDCQNAAC